MSCSRKVRQTLLDKRILQQGLSHPHPRRPRPYYTTNRPALLTPMYNCARIKLTAPRDGCKLWSMRLIIHPGGSHDQEQDSEYHTRIVSTREVHSRHRHHVRAGQEYGAQVSASSGTLEHAPSAAQSSLQARSVQRADQAVDQARSLLQLRVHAASSAGYGLHRELERAQSLCPSLASPGRWALSGGALRNRAGQASPVRLGRVQV